MSKIESSINDIRNLERLTETLYRRATHYRYLLERIYRKHGGLEIDTETIELPSTADFYEKGGTLSRLEHEITEWNRLDEQFSTLFTEARELPE